MSEETQSEPQNEEAPKSPTEEAQPVSIEFIEDGAAFIRETNAAPSAPLTEVVVGGKGFRIRKVSGHEIASVLSAQFRKTKVDGEEHQQYDALATSDQMLCSAVQMCVVNKEGKPIWLMPQVVSMWTGFDKNGKHGDKYSELLQQLYEKVIQVNPTLHPAQNNRAAQMMFAWNG